MLINNFLNNILCILYVIILIVTSVLAIVKNSSISNKNKSEICKITNCYLICTSGLIATISNDINEAYSKVTNCNTGKIILIIFNYKEEHNNVIPKNWFSGVNSTLRINKFRIMNSDIYKIDDNAFYSIHFSEVERIQFSQLKLENLTSNIFSGFTLLQYLLLESIPLKNIEENVLSPMRHTLTNLELDMMSYPLNLENMTGSDDLKITQLVLRLNNFKDKLDENSFRGLKLLQSLNLESSGITHLHEKTFVHFGLNFKQLILSDNKLKTLTPELFSPIINNQNITIDITDNPFVCDCSLLGLQQQMKTYESVFRSREKVTCKLPGETKDFKVLEVDLCR